MLYRRRAARWTKGMKMTVKGVGKMGRVSGEQTQTFGSACCCNANCSALTTPPSENPEGLLLNAAYKPLRVIVLL